MNSRLTDEFLAHFKQLPKSVQDHARKNYRRWRVDPNHPGLHFKRIHGQENLWSVRVGLGWRALGLLQGNTIYWFWIGSHGDYDKAVKHL